VIADALSVIAVVTGLVFYAAGTVGLLRFPDGASRLHALTKADNLGLGFVVLGAAFRADDLWTVAKLGLVWVLTLAAAATAAQLIARSILPPDVLEKVRER
jgi:multicomponent Na+:H+ antiporter subunit G